MATPKNYRGGEAAASAATEEISTLGKIITRAMRLLTRLGALIEEMERSALVLIHTWHHVPDAGYLVFLLVTGIPLRF